MDRPSPPERVFSTQLSRLTHLGRHNSLRKGRPRDCWHHEMSGTIPILSDSDWIEWYLTFALAGFLGIYTSVSLQERPQHNSWPATSWAFLRGGRVLRGYLIGFLGGSRALWGYQGASPDSGGLGISRPPTGQTAQKAADAYWVAQNYVLVHITAPMWMDNSD